MALARRLLYRTFGRPSGLLGRLGGLVMARMNGRCGAWVLDRLDVGNGDRVLEIGIGPGVVVPEAAERPPNGLVAGVDPSDIMLAQATRRNAAAIGSGDVVLRRAEAADLPFPDGSFDKVLAINSMQVWPDPVAGLVEVRRVLAPGGSVALGFTPQSGQSREGAVSKHRAAGLSDARVLEHDACFCVLATAS